VGYDVKEKDGVIILGYAKWDRFREALEWTLGLLANEPGKGT
jgi:hypothetical protein